MLPIEYPSWVRRTTHRLQPHISIGWPVTTISRWTRVALLYIAFYLTALWALVFYMPINDFDSMSSYLARIKLEDFGPLEQTATLSVQYLFPKSFDYCHKPFLWFGYFQAMPSFTLFCVFICSVINRRNRYKQMLALFLVFACQPMLVTATGAKNDLALGVTAYFTTLAACTIRNKSTYLPVTMLGVAFLAGTKWHGLGLAAIISTVVAWRAVRDRLINLRAVGLVGILLPVYWIASSASVYMSNYVRDGTITPVPEWLFSQKPPLFTNLCRVTALSIFEAFTIPAFVFERLWAIDLMPIARAITCGAYQREFSLMPSCDAVAFGPLLLLVLVADVYVLLHARSCLRDRVFSGIALAYCAMLLTRVYYTNWNERYLLAAYVLSFPPAIAAAWVHMRDRRVRAVCVCYALLVSTHALLCTAERRLVPMVDRSGARYDTIFSAGIDRELLQFHMWTGYRDVYLDYRQRVRKSDTLLIINNLQGGNVPFLYPFIQGRESSNTAVVSPAQTPGLTYDETAYTFLLIFSGSAQSPIFQRVHHYPGEYELSLYERTPR